MNQLLKCNYHTHTSRCKHASGKDREYVEMAIRAGMEILGFSDHIPYVFSKKGFVSSCRMEFPELEGYITSVLELREEYKADIQILLGFEAEYAPKQFPKVMKRIREYPIDYLLLGQHFLDEEVTGQYVGQPCGENFLGRYVEQSLEALETGQFLYMAHPDVIRFQGMESVFQRYMKPLLQYLKDHEMPVEYNLLGQETNRHYPGDRLLRLASEVGNTMIIGCDAHQPEALFNQSGIEAARKRIASFGLELTEGPLKLPKVF